MKNITISTFISVSISISIYLILSFTAFTTLASPTGNKQVPGFHSPVDQATKKVQESQTYLTNEVKHGTDPAIDGIPHYWDLSETTRPVFLSSFSMLRRNAIDPALDHMLHLIEPVHTEIHVGNTAFSIFALRDGPQKIASRPVEVSSYFVKKYPKDAQLFMCETKKTDLDIYKYVSDNFKGSYHIALFNCNHFTRFLLSFLCPRAEFPSQYNYFAKFGTFLHETMHKTGIANVPILGKHLEKIDKAAYFGSSESDPDANWPWIDMGHKIKNMKNYDSDGDSINDE